MRLNIRYKAQSSARNQRKQIWHRFCLPFLRKSTPSGRSMQRYYTCFRVNLTLHLSRFWYSWTTVYCHQQQFSSEKREKSTKIPTLKANSNLKQSKNKIRMLKEIKMLHNKITKKTAKNTMEVWGSEKTFFFYHNFITHPSKERQLHETI